mmetsp:Transcript_35927/g.101756  ORF Transcript_35927/g.101756 Transcript_35927/m.101756 type:complete len:490 (-) Transcript_35927:716-2185(-)
MGGGEGAGQATKNLHVLLADGDDHTRQGISCLLQRKGHKVTEVADGSVALAFLCASNGPASPNPVDVVLIDVVSAGISGLDFLQKMNGNAPLSSIPVIIMSGNGTSQELVLRCLGAGARENFTKPICESQLDKLQQHMWQQNQANTPLQLLPSFFQAVSGQVAVRNSREDSRKSSSGGASATSGADLQRGLLPGGSWDRRNPTEESESSKDKEASEGEDGGSAHGSNGQIGGKSGKQSSSEEGSRNGSCVGNPGLSPEEGQQLPGSHSILPPALFQLAQLGNQREAAAKQLLLHSAASLPAEALTTSSQLNHSNSCSAFTTFTGTEVGALVPPIAAPLPQIPTSHALQLAQLESAAACSQAPLLQLNINQLLAAWGPLMPSIQPALGLAHIFPAGLQQMFELPKAPLQQQQPQTSAPMFSAEEDGGSHVRRAAALAKFREKRKSRNFDRKVRYESRKRLAEERPRVRGQFVKRMDDQQPLVEDAVKVAE